MQFEEAKQGPIAESKACSLCQKQIELAKFKLHDVMCHRMNFKCQTCGAVANKKEVHVCEVPEPIVEEVIEVPVMAQEPEAQTEQSMKEIEEAT